jgi:hypothetical protein
MILVCYIFAFLRQQGCIPLLTLFAKSYPGIYGLSCNLWVIAEFILWQLRQNCMLDFIATFPYNYYISNKPNSAKRIH